MIKIATKGEKGSAIVASTTKAVTKLAEKGKQLTTKVAAKAKEFKKQVNTAIAQAKQNGRKQLDHLQSALQGNRQNDFALAGGGKLVTQTTRKEKPTDTLVQASSGKGSSSTKGTGKVQTGGRELSVDEYLKRLDEADDMYESFRKSKTDVNSIAKNTGMNEQRVQRIKDHLLFKEHIKEHGGWSWTF